MRIKDESVECVQFQGPHIIMHAIDDPAQRFSLRLSARRMGTRMIKLL